MLNSKFVRWDNGGWLMVNILFVARLDCHNNTYAPVTIRPGAISMHQVSFILVWIDASVFWAPHCLAPAHREIQEKIYTYIYVCMCVCIYWRHANTAWYDQWVWGTLMVCVSLVVVVVAVGIGGCVAWFLALSNLFGFTWLWYDCLFCGVFFFGVRNDWHDLGVEVKCIKITLAHRISRAQIDHIDRSVFSPRRIGKFN